MIVRNLAAAALALAASTAFAQASPVGLWKTIDDGSKQEKSLVRITDTGGVLSGKVEKLLAGAKQDAKCDDCRDERKGQPVLGMTIIKGAKADAANETWEGGEILDPNDGKTYRLRLKPIDGGKALEVRGYIGPFFRNQKWIRVE